MTRNQIFGAALGGAAVLVLISSVFSSGGSDHKWVTVHDGNGRVVVSGDSLEIENQGDDVVVHTKDGTFNCTKNGGSVVINRENGRQTEIICD